MSNLETVESHPKAEAERSPAITQGTNGSSGALGIIAAAIVLGFLYWASSVMITVMLAILIAYFLDPFVTSLEHIHIPRALGALIVLLAAAASLAAVGYTAAGRVDNFLDAWPKYSADLKREIADVDKKLASVDQQVTALAPAPSPQRRAPATVRVEEDTQPVRTLLLRGLGSIYSFLLVAAFLPFMVYFMLAAKRRLWQSTIEFFPEGQRYATRETLDQISRMMRSYVAGNLLIAGILSVACWIFFWAIHLESPVVLGVASGFLNLIPYIGAVLSWLPPMVVGLAHWKTAGPFLGIAGVLTGLHVIAQNVLVPAIVGRRVHLNAVAVTISLLFWGWMWGAAGLILAIPITAVLKVICDHVPSWKPAGHWLGSES